MIFIVIIIIIMLTIIIIIKILKADIAEPLHLRNDLLAFWAAILSVEFAEHRSYETGDEVKHIDWKLYGKTNRLYVKRFEEETNLRAHLILDTSKSMTYASGKVTKLDYGSYLLAALSYLMISQQDAAGVVLFDEKIRSIIPPKST